MTSALISHHEITRRMALEELVRRRARVDLATFIRLLWPVLHPDPDDRLEWEWHHDAIADHISAALSGEFGGRWLFISVPPGTGKSSIASRYAPAHHRLMNPSSKIITISHTIDLAARLQGDRRKIIGSPMYRWLLGGYAIDAETQAETMDWSIVPGADRKRYYETTASGWASVYGASKNSSGTTGTHCTGMIIDDIVPVKPGVMDPAGWQQAADFVTGTLQSRFENVLTGAKVYIGQRIGSMDPTDLLLRHYPDAVHLCIPRELTRATFDLCPCGGRCALTPLGYSDPRTVEGEMLPSARMSREHLDKMTAQVRAAQENQIGIAIEGSLFKIDDWQSWRVLPQKYRIFGTVDATAGGLSRQASHHAAQVWAYASGHLYLLDELHMRTSPGQAMRAFGIMARRWPRIPWEVEEKALGAAMIETFKKRGVRVAGSKPDKRGSKTRRAESWSPMVASGQVQILSPDSERPSQMAPYVSPDVLLRLPEYQSLRACRQLIRMGSYRSAIEAYVRIDPPRPGTPALAVYQRITAVLAGLWIAGSPEWRRDWTGEFVAVPEAESDRADAAEMAVHRHRAAMARESERLGYTVGETAPPKRAPWSPS